MYLTDDFSPVLVRRGQSGKDCDVGWRRAVKELELKGRGRLEIEATRALVVDKEGGGDDGVRLLR